MTAGPSNPPLAPVRIGVLGAARITKGALIEPAAKVPGVEVAASAARSTERAQAYASEHGIGRVHGSYEALLDDPAIDAVYIPLPAALHPEWSIAAINAGKHVLCEKPFTASTTQSQRVADVANAADVTVMEAYHSHYHPFQARLIQIVQSGEIGQVTRARTQFCAPIPPGKDIRWQRSLGGGGLRPRGQRSSQASTASVFQGRSRPSPLGRRGALPLTVSTRG